MLRQMAEKAATAVLLRRRSQPSRPQTMTIARSLEDVEKFWRDPVRLTEAFEGFAEVVRTGPGKYRWTFKAGDREWNATVGAGVASLRFESEHGSRIRIAFQFTPNSDGTAVTMTVTSPLPEKIVSIAMFRALYRARAILQTGEAPTLQGTGDARAAG